MFMLQIDFFNPTRILLTKIHCFRAFCFTDTQIFYTVQLLLSLEFRQNMSKTFEILVQLHFQTGNCKFGFISNKFVLVRLKSNMGYMAYRMEMNTFFNFFWNKTGNEKFRFH